MLEQMIIACGICWNLGVGVGKNLLIVYLYRNLSHLAIKINKKLNFMVNSVANV